MSKRDIGMILAAVLLFGSATLWGAIRLVDTYAFADDDHQMISDQR